jgi:hypothetical protein
MLDWFTRSKAASVEELIARKNYGKAIEVLKAEIQKRRKDRRLRLQLADVLILAGKGKEAAPILAGLADELVLAGHAAQAIALLKRIQTADPGREEVEEKLAYLIAQQSRPADDPWHRRHKTAQVYEMGMDEIGLSPLYADQEPGELGEPAGPSVETPEGEAPPEEATAAEEAEGTPQAEPPAAEGQPAEDDAFRDELVSFIEDALTPRIGELGAVTIAQPAEPVASPLFKDFESDELAAVIRGLRLRTFLPGEIVVSEGEPGDSLFILTSGLVRTYVRQPSGRNEQVRELKDGDFFGEISLLSGLPRSATVTAATRCDLLEMDRQTLDSIVQSHPRVMSVLEQFALERAGQGA